MFRKTRGVFRDFSNYRFIWKAIRKNRNTPEWVSNNLRHDWVGRIYTVVSLKEEDMDDTEEMKRLKVLDRLKFTNAYLTTLNLQEIIFPAMEPIEGTLSYLVVYSPILRNFSVAWLLKTIVFLTTLGIIANMIVNRL